jgi:peptidoglycan lytic transglycosylase
VEARRAIVPAVLFFAGPLLLILFALVARATGRVEGAHTVRERMLQFIPQAEAASRATGVDLALLLAVGSSESAGLPGAVSHRGAVGLMQLMGPTATELNGGVPADLRDPAVSLRLGAAYLAAQLGRFADQPCPEQLALAAYNAGPRRVSEWVRARPLAPDTRLLGDWVPFEETRQYLARVQRWRVLWQDHLDGT